MPRDAATDETTNLELRWPAAVFAAEARALLRLRKPTFGSWAEGRCTRCTPQLHWQHAAILGLAVDLTAGKLGLHWWYLVGVGLVTLVIGWLLRPPPATPPKPSSLVSGNVGNRFRMRDSKVWVQQS